MAAHLSGARLLPDPDAGRRALAARARRAAGAAGAGPLARDRRLRARGGADRAQPDRLARDRHRHRRGRRSRPDRGRRAALRGRGSRSGSTSRATSTAPPTTSPTSRSSSSSPGTGSGTRRSRRRTRRRSASTSSASSASSPSAAASAVGEQGRALGWALAFAWVACPWTLYVMNANANDSLIAALGIGALLALRSAPAARRLRRARRGGEVRPRGARAVIRHRERRAALARGDLVLARLRRGRCRLRAPVRSRRRPARDLRPHARLPGDPQLAVQHLGLRRRRWTSCSRSCARRRSRSPSASRSIRASRPRSRSPRWPPR